MGLPLQIKNSFVYPLTLVYIRLDVWRHPWCIQNSMGCLHGNVDQDPLWFSSAVVNLIWLKHILADKMIAGWIVFAATSLCPTTMFYRQMELRTSSPSRQFTCLQQPKHARKHLKSSSEQCLQLSSIRTEHSPQQHLQPCD